MANPRKFSEKIAIHNQRQAEGTANFEQIMKEVTEATSRVAPDRAAAKNTLRINQSLGSFRGGSLPNVSAGGPTVKSATHVSDNVKPEETVQHSHSPRERNRSQVGPMRRPADRRHDTSPYSSGAYLSPPPDTSWRRTNSDSALHQTAQGMGERSDSNSRWQQTHLGNNHQEQNDGRPRSSCDVPRVPGIHIYTTAHEPGTIQIPIGNNTGSLPDLTSVHFPSPLHTPLDHDHDAGSSPYSSSPVNTSPSTLSPTSVPPGVRPPASFQFPIPPQHQNHLSVPYTSSRTLHSPNKNVSLDNNIADLLNNGYSQSPMGNMSGMYHQQQQPQQCSPSSPSPTAKKQWQAFSQLQHQNPGYRSPRPSPQSSPGLGGRHSAPSSPAAAPLSPLNTSNEYVLNQQLFQPFQQITMDWAQLVASLVESGCTWSAQVQDDRLPVSNAHYIDTPTVLMSQAHSGSGLTDVTNFGNSELTGDAGYFSTSPSTHVYPTAPASLHTTPNTPTITLTDFSVDDFTRQEYKHLEAELFASDVTDESLREGLVPLDLDGLQMLADPELNLISDGDEDHFRLNRS